MSDSLDKQISHSVLHGPEPDVHLGDVDIATAMEDVASWARFLPGPSLDSYVSRFPPTATRYGVVACGFCIFLLSGYNVALMGSVSSDPSYLRRLSLDDGTANSQVLIGVVNAIYWVGVIIGAFLAGWLSDRVGRRKAIVSAALYALCVIPVLAGLQNFQWALWLRLLNGFATGAMDSVGISFTAETAAHDRRGRAVGFELTGACIGASLSYFTIYGLRQDTNSEVVWKFPLALQIVFAWMVISLVFLLPESPRFLVKVGRYDQARKILDCIKAMPTTADGAREAAISDEIKAIQQTLKDERLHNSSTGYLKMMFRQDRYSTPRRTCSAMFVQFSAQMLVGVGFVSGYGQLILETSGWSSDISSLLSGVGILTQALFAFLGAFVSDRLGRRRAMAAGAAVCACLLCFMGMCGYFVNKYSAASPSRAKHYGSATLSLLLLWSAIYGFTWVGQPFTYPSEIFPARSRAKGSSFGIIGFASGSFLANMISTYMFASIGYRALFMIAGFSLLVSGIVFFFMKETANKTLEEVDRLFD